MSRRPRGASTCTAAPCSAFWRNARRGEARPLSPCRGGGVSSPRLHLQPRAAEDLDDLDLRLGGQLAAAVELGGPFLAVNEDADQSRLEGGGGFAALADQPRGGV